MTTQFPRGKIMGSEDLAISLVDSNDNPTDAYEISYAIYQVTSMGEVPIGPTQREPVHPELGMYYASFQIPEDAELGTYRIRWSFQQSTTSPVNMVMEEFEIVKPEVFQTSLWSPIQADMIRRLRIILRDNDPSRNYHFRPPTSEGTMSERNRAFSYIWTDEELIEYMERGVDFINLWPPETHWNSIDKMVKAKPAWRQMILMAAIAHAAMALTLNWIEEEFSIVGEEEVTVILPDGNEIDIPIEDLYATCKVSSSSKNQIRDAYDAGQLKVRSVNPENGEVGEEIVKDVMKHNTPHKDIVKVTTERGRSVKCTEDHSLFTVSKQGMPIPAEASSLSVGDPLVIVYEGDGYFSTEKIESILYLPPEKDTYDLCVPGPENFVLMNGMLAHNSYSIGGVSLDIQKSSKYEGIKNNAESQLDKMLEAKTRTVKIIRGLRQSRLGVGVRSAFGPATGHGVLTPARYLGL